jgi:uncharacterized protein YifN (PemK superfamily)
MAEVENMWQSGCPRNNRSMLHILGVSRAETIGPLLVDQFDTCKILAHAAKVKQKSWPNVIKNRCDNIIENKYQMLLKIVVPMLSKTMVEFLKTMSDNVNKKIDDNVIQKYK